MDDADDNVTAGHLVVGSLGLALLRGWYRDGTRNAEIAALITTVLTDERWLITIDPQARDMLDGYAEWAPVYDGDNPMIDTEERHVRPILEPLAGPDVRALDAGCGTGRHSRFLTGLGCVTTGVDQSPAMLAIARSKVPDAEFVEGPLDRLPLPDDEFDIAVASLALCHLADPAPAVAELSRVVRPGGTVVISDPHANGTVMGGQAFYRGPDGHLSWVTNHYHPASTWLRAFRAASLEVVDCIEPGYSDDHLRSNPAFHLDADAMRAAAAGLPSLWVWHLRA